MQIGATQGQMGERGEVRPCCAPGRPRPDLTTRVDGRVIGLISPCEAATGQCRNAARPALANKYTHTENSASASAIPLFIAAGQAGMYSDTLVLWKSNSSGTPPACAGLVPRHTSLERNSYGHNPAADPKNGTCIRCALVHGDCDLAQLVGPFCCAPSSLLRGPHTMRWCLCTPHGGGGSITAEA